MGIEQSPIPTEGESIENKFTYKPFYSYEDKEDEEEIIEFADKLSNSVVTLQQIYEDLQAEDLERIHKMSYLPHKSRPVVDSNKRSDKIRAVKEKLKFLGFSFSRE